ncbi:MAG: hypothetical protein WD065_03475 [Planctomycetaceae bacterium]
MFHDSMMEFEVMRGRARIRQGWLGWRWVETIVPDELEGPR